MAAAIITGASSGIGKSFAEQIPHFFSDIDELWLIARRKDRLEEIAREEKKKFPGIKYVIIPADLAKEDGLKKIESTLKEKNPNIKLLINNAGFGKFGKFADVPLSEFKEMINLNINAVLHLTHICLPNMGEGSAIIQVASAAAYIPLPHNAVYAATKAFILSFSAALASEVRKKGIHVMALCPGPVKTEFFSRFYGKEVITHSSSHKDPNDVVKCALKDAVKKKWVSIPGKRIKLAVFLSRILPNKLLLKLMSIRGRRNSKEYR